MKTRSTFFPAVLVEQIRRNSLRLAWANPAREQAIQAAAPWLAMNDDALWSLMFAHTLPRSWMVWSNGHCPACRRDVPMYTWLMDPFADPWKTRCPHCRELFPKNDFAAFYRSGLTEAGQFDPARADRTLLFNSEHPDPSDPLHAFGVDDGQGYTEGDKRWRFIAAYLVYGQWRKAVYGGILSLAQAHVLTGEPAYARKAGILLDRVADLYPEFDFAAEGWVYEKQYPSQGYVSTWHDACEETRELALAYDQVFEALRADRELIAFLGGKAHECGLPRPKDSFDDVQRNIEDGLLRHPLANRKRIESNPPRTDLAFLTFRSILSWHEDPAPILEDIGRMIDAHTAVDGVTGEKGLSAYSSYVIQSLAQFLQVFERMSPGFLAEMVRRHPRLRETWRFFLDTWCLQSYYPSCGDSGYFAGKALHSAGAVFHKGAPLAPGMFSFFERLYDITADPAYIQTLYSANDNRLDDLPHDLSAADPDAFQQKAAEVIRREGPRLRLGSVNKSEWHLAILRAGSPPHERALWLDYDSGSRHAHMDGLNIGLFARGLDLLPDFGYPPVQFGGWESPRSRWYMKTAAHNTVTVDGEDQSGWQFNPKEKPIAAAITLWRSEPGLQIVRASGANLYKQTRQYERTLLLVDVSDADFYIVDIFRVAGGTDHAKFTGSHFGTVETTGLNLKPGDDYARGTQLRHFRTDASAAPGWQADWSIEDRYGYLPANSQVHFRYTDLTEGAEASLCEAWVTTGGFNAMDEAWVPRLMVRRRSESGDLASTFVSVMEPYEGAPLVKRARRVSLVNAAGDALARTHVAVEIELADGRRDLIVARDTEDPLRQAPTVTAGDIISVPEWNIQTGKDVFWKRR
jgi:hypothetical protein